MAWESGTLSESPHYLAIRAELERDGLLTPDTITASLLHHGEAETIRLISALITSAFQHGLTKSELRKENVKCQSH